MNNSTASKSDDLQHELEQYSQSLIKAKRNAKIFGILEFIFLIPGFMNPVLAIFVFIFAILFFSNYIKSKKITKIINSLNNNTNKTIVSTNKENIIPKNLSNNINKPDDIYLKKLTGKNKSINKSQGVFDNFVVVDLETTGLEPTRDYIIEIAAAKYENNEIIDTYTTLVNPEVFIPPNITNINHIDNDMVKDCPEIKEVLPGFMNFIGQLPLVAHNAPFDIKFLNANLALLGLYLNNPIIDTLPISRKLFSEIENHKLGTIKEYLNIDVQDSHRALPDCYVCGQIYLEYSTKEKNKKALANIKLHSDIGLNKEECYSIVKEILKKHNKDLTYVRYGFTSNYFDIRAFYNFLRLKLKGKKYYALLDNSLAEINSMIPDLTLKYEVAPKSESNKIRILINSPEDLYILEPIIIQAFDKCIDSMEYYRNNVSVAEKNIAEYLNT
ncbi:3'-5' exonuclease [Clostridium kluyveri]|uniref:DNA polymerase III, epsilon subunit related exonuclease n=2 Tax=Clostridium kluyveri TaxID=1534 RepID=A5F9M6_CLOK5|nr:3'-5' exonuclease [Clostridium kluyveri]ABQ23633.1 DNA polymerase III, epsilon subunit related exonuclease [Clostridium kluyveri DSM 555]